MRHVLILMLLAMVLAVTSCTKENEVGKTTEPQIENKNLQAQFEAWMDKYKDKTFDATPMSLKEINDQLVEDGQPPFSAEEFGVSEEAFNRLMNGFPLEDNSDKLSLRTSYCYPPVNSQDYWVMFLIDYNQDGDFDQDDITEIRDVILGEVPPSNESENFGYVSYEILSINEYLSTYDIAVAYNFRYLNTYC